MEMEFTVREVDSVDGMRSPFMVMELSAGEIPRMSISSPSPSSRWSETPGTRCAASATFGSGKPAIWSADTTFTMFDAVFC